MTTKEDGSLVTGARRTCRYYTSEVNSVDLGDGTWGPLYFPDVALPTGARVQHAYLILEGCLVDTSGAANHLTAGYLQINKDGGSFWGSTQVTRCPYDIPANGMAPIKLLANVGPPGGIVPATNPNGTYGARVSSITSVGGAGTLEFNGHWILEIEYST